MAVRDRFDRPLRSLRISVTDRCNLRCQYCMPEEEYVWLPRGDILTFEEIGALVDAFTDAGADRVRLTGGEPLLRKDLPDLIRRLAQKPAIRDLALTTNGMLLADQAADLREAGLHRLTVSLDTLRADRFRELTRFDGVAAVQHGLAAGAGSGLHRPEDRHRGHPRRQRRRARRPARLRPAGGRRGALHRVHGRRRRDPLVGAGRPLARRDAADDRGRARTGDGHRGGIVRPRRTGSACRTARRSASSRPPPSHSAARATAAA